MFNFYRAGDRQGKKREDTKVNEALQSNTVSFTHNFCVPGLASSGTSFSASPNFEGKKNLSNTGRASE